MEGNYSAEYSLMYVQDGRYGYCDVSWDSLRSAVMTHIDRVGLPKYVLSNVDDLKLKVIPCPSDKHTPYRLKLHHGRLT